MFRDEATEVAPTWAQDDQTDESYREIDTQLRRIAAAKTELDVDEAKWLREAERQRVWRRLGYATALEYLEEVFAYAPRTAMDRLRVAKELGELPELEAEMRSGALPWSAAKELTRVVTPATVSRWLQCVRGKNVHEIQALVSGLKKGDDPGAPKDPSRMTRRLVLDLPPALDALFEKTRLKLEQERGEHLEDVDVFESMCLLMLEPSSPPPMGGKAPKPMHRIVTYKCDDCGRAWREGRGRLVPITPTDFDLAACDAELMPVLTPAQLVSDGDSVTTKTVLSDSRSTSDDASGSPHCETNDSRSTRRRVRTKRRPPPTLTIPKATRDFVWARDCGHCRVPGCRATRHLACHHIELQSHGGDHDPANIVLVCDGHHKVLHSGLLTITGRAPDQLTFTRDGNQLVDARASFEIEAADPLRKESNGTPSRNKHDATTCDAINRKATVRSRFADVVKLEHAKQALMQLGFKARTARAALELASAHVGTNADVALLVKTVLDIERTARVTPTNEDPHADATNALVQLGYPRTTATAAVEAASAHVGTSADLAALLKDALRRCGSS